MDVSTVTVAAAVAEIAPDAAVVRGWIRSDEPPALLDALVEASVAWLAGDAWGFPDVWWMASSAVPDQLEACSARRIDPGRLRSIRYRHHVGAARRGSTRGERRDVIQWRTMDEAR